MLNYNPEISEPIYMQDIPKNNRIRQNSTLAYSYINITYRFLKIAQHSKNEKKLIQKISIGKSVLRLKVSLHIINVY